MHSLLVILLSALASLIDLPIAAADFRFSAGIIVLVVALLLNKNFSPLTLGLLTGFAVCLTRVIYASAQGIEPDVLSYFLEILFYLGYVAVYRLVVLHDDKIYSLPLVISLSLSDFGGNALEYFSRLAFGYETWSSVPLSTLMLGALVRSVLIILIVYLYVQIMRWRGQEVINPLLVYGIVPDDKKSDLDSEQDTEA